METKTPEGKVDMTSQTPDTEKGEGDGEGGPEGEDGEDGEGLLIEILKS